jgi:galactose-1-phosphate uridylyltransferase
LLRLSLVLVKCPHETIKPTAPIKLNQYEIDQIILENNILNQVKDDLIEGVYILDDLEVSI